MEEFDMYQNTSSNDSAITTHIKDVANPLFSVTTYIVGVFIISSNVLVIRAVLVTEALQTKANMYVVSLACTDALVGVLELVLGTQYLVPSWFNSAKYACLASFVLSYFPVSCSGMNMCLIAVDRYYYIMKPLQYERVVTERKIRLAISAVWILAMVFGACVLLFNNYDTTHHCSIQDVVPTVIRTYVGVGLFLVCGGVTAVLYARIGWLTYKTFQKIVRRQDVIFMSSYAARSAPRPSFTTRGPGRGSVKALKLFVTLFGVLLVCWCPYFLIEVITVFHDVDPNVYFTSMIMGFLNSGINAFVYSYISRDFRIALRKMLCCPQGRVSHMPP